MAETSLFEAVWQEARVSLEAAAAGVGPQDDRAVEALADRYGVASSYVDDLFSSAYRTLAALDRAQRLFVAFRPYGGGSTWPLL